MRLSCAVRVARAHSVLWSSVITGQTEDAMLAGEAVVAIWNGVADDARADFHAWHCHEHMPERVGIPGFRRGRRFVAATDDTHPEFFTLYEADTMQVLQGADYTNRLNAPTPSTRKVTAQFRDTARALARVLLTVGPGCGGAMLTIGFDADAEAEAALADAVRRAAGAPRVTGAHLCRADDAASSVKTAESRARTDIGAPPSWFVMVEATDAPALSKILPDQELRAAGGTVHRRGVYRLEYERLKTAFA
ncbi:MAG: hypothetical protein ABI369_07415 [Acetobacteraceae bacterium]